MLCLQHLLQLKAEWEVMLFSSAVYIDLCKMTCKREVGIQRVIAVCFLSYLLSLINRQKFVITAKFSFTIMKMRVHLAQPGIWGVGMRWLDGKSPATCLSVFHITCENGIGLKHNHLLNCINVLNKISWMYL